MFWFEHAPANIALIKYMGKKSATNLPDNPSLSYTLDNLFSTVQLEIQAGKKDYWEPLNIPGGEPFQLSQEGQHRFLKHLAFLKAHFGYTGGFVVRSTNNFPASTGLASSASSFAALTKCAVTALCELTHQPLLSLEDQAKLSRQGSGSSCRSFFSPWVIWEDEIVSPLIFPWKNLLHQVVLISHVEKKVSSSEAHQRVKTSPFYEERAARASANLQGLCQALEMEDWDKACSICWTEFQDMHNLFVTSAEPFSYINENTVQVLDWIEAYRDAKGEGPIVTMDAGPNIHLLYKPEQEHLAFAFRQEYLLGNYDVL